MQLVPIFTFMLIPVWIPLVAAAFGMVSDAIKAPAKAVTHHGAARPAPRHAGVSPVGPRVLAEGTAR
ncbi:hypothetical protein BJ993_001784 [Nocardioides aromaticivorans]|uniref:Uncharacterized protein n=1 Tax=Nocardioides aromaticivorans TaxID=200618 RepID=A0A7Y9ZFX1_9ACTN|nr:hypothetical protein [Nocardioides aromaticivorans]NYI44704.1 hypothetical protein [Nocardioides aromaticivorans]